MKFKAYILAADPNWMEASVSSYYDWVDEIVVSYDKNGIGWSGKSIPLDECLRRLQAIDKDKKFRYVTGDYYRPQFTPMDNDTYQRQCAIDEIGNSADWIVELDTDEVLPNAKTFFENLGRVPKDRLVFEWPMRSFFQKTKSGRYLEVTTLLRRQLSEYPGPVATRPGVRLNCARRVANAPCWRVDIRKINRGPSEGRYVADAVISKDDAILHFSWVRSEMDILNKVRGWSHASDFNGEKYIADVWKAAPWKWPFLYNFHPVYPKIWKALKPVSLDKRLDGP